MHRASVSAPSSPWEIIVSRQNLLQKASQGLRLHSSVIHKIKNEISELKALQQAYQEALQEKQAKLAALLAGHGDAKEIDAKAIQVCELDISYLQSCQIQPSDIEIRASRLDAEERFAKARDTLKLFIAGLQAKCPSEQADGKEPSITPEAVKRLLPTRAVQPECSAYRFGTQKALLLALINILGPVMDESWQGALIIARRVFANHLKTVADPTRIVPSLEMNLAKVLIAHVLSLFDESLFSRFPLDLVDEAQSPDTYLLAHTQQISWEWITSINPFFGGAAMAVRENISYRTYREQFPEIADYAGFAEELSQLFDLPKHIALMIRSCLMPIEKHDDAEGILMAIALGLKDDDYFTYTHSELRGADEHKINSFIERRFVEQSAVIRQRLARYIEKCAPIGVLLYFLKDDDCFKWAYKNYNSVQIQVYFQIKMREAGHRHGEWRIIENHGQNWPIGVAELAASMEEKNKWQLKDTKQDGSSHFHAVFGREDGGIISCSPEQVKDRRQKIREAVCASVVGTRLDQHKKEIYQLAFKGVLNLLIVGTEIKAAPNISALQQAYKEWLLDMEEDDDALWDAFQAELCSKSPKLFQSILSVEATSLRKSFHLAVQKQPDLHRQVVFAYKAGVRKAYIGYINRSALLERWRKSITVDMIKEYGDYLQQDQQWYWPFDLRIMAIVFDKPILVYTSKDSEPIKLNIFSGKIQAHILFNESSFYQRMVIAPPDLNPNKVEELKNLIAEADKRAIAEAEKRAIAGADKRAKEPQALASALVPSALTGPLAATLRGSRNGLPVGKGSSSVVEPDTRVAVLLLPQR